MKSLVPGGFYWAASEKHGDGKMTVVQVSTVFGEDPDYWTLAVLGSDQHHMIDDFEIFEQAEPAPGRAFRQAAE